MENAVESDSGLYKCPQDDTEWQRLQVYGSLLIALSFFLSISSSRASSSSIASSLVLNRIDLIIQLISSQLTEEKNI